MFVILAHNWWMLLLRGILALVFGILCLAYPSVTLIVMTIMFGVYALLDGIIALASSISTAKGRPRWWSTFVEGIVGVIFGLLISSYPAGGAAVVWWIGRYAIFVGNGFIALALRLRKWVARAQNRARVMEVPQSDACRNGAQSKSGRLAFQPFAR